MDDESIMPVGEFKGRKLANVPAYHLLWRYRANRATGALREYIKDNYDVLMKENEEEKAKNSHARY